MLLLSILISCLDGNFITLLAPLKLGPCIVLKFSTYWEIFLKLIPTSAVRFPPCQRPAWIPKCDLPDSYCWPHTGHPLLGFMDTLCLHGSATCHYRHCDLPVYLPCTTLMSQIDSAHTWYTKNCWITVPGLHSSFSSNSRPWTLSCHTDKWEHQGHLKKGLEPNPQKRVVLPVYVGIALASTEGLPVILSLNKCLLTACYYPGTSVGKG